MDSRRQLGGWLRGSHAFKECVIAHQSSRSAPIMVGTKLSTEATDAIVLRDESVVGERSLGSEAGPRGLAVRH